MSRSRSTCFRVLTLFASLTLLATLNKSQAAELQLRAGYSFTPAKTEKPAKTKKGKKESGKAAASELVRSSEVNSQTPEGKATIEQAMNRLPQYQLLLLVSDALKSEKELRAFIFSKAAKILMATDGRTMGDDDDLLVEVALEERETQFQHGGPGSALTASLTVFLVVKVKDEATNRASEQSNVKKTSLRKLFEIPHPWQIVAESCGSSVQSQSYETLYIDPASSTLGARDSLEKLQFSPRLPEVFRGFTITSFQRSLIHFDQNVRDWESLKKIVDTYKGWLTIKIRETANAETKLGMPAFSNSAEDIEKIERALELLSDRNGQEALNQLYKLDENGKRLFEIDLGGRRGSSFLSLLFKESATPKEQTHILVLSWDKLTAYYFLESIRAITSEYQVPRTIERTIKSFQ